MHLCLSLSPLETPAAAHQRMKVISTNNVATSPMAEGPAVGTTTAL